MFACSLATDLVEPAARLFAIQRAALEQKKRFEALKTLPVPDVTVPGAGIILPQLVELFGRSSLVDRVPLFGNLVISNVPGPPVPLYIAGARIATLYPCSIPFHGSALNVTVQSYCDRLDFGLIACRRACPDVRELADGLVDSFAELMKSLKGGQIHDDPRPQGSRPPDRADSSAPGSGAGAGVDRPEAGPARDPREDEAPRNRHQKNHREPAQGHRGVALR
jgi:hypothetical protein